MPKPDRLAGLTEEEKGRWVHADALIENSEVGVKIQDSWDEGDVYEALSDQPEHEIISVLWAWRVKAALESLALSRASEARKRALLEKHQYKAGKYCRECGMMRSSGCANYCALAAELEGG